jgi:CRP-like cAMP-binding protein
MDQARDKRSYNPDTRKVTEESMFDKQQPSSNRRSVSMAAAPISLQECVELLAHIPLFCELSRRELRNLADAGIQRDYPAGTVIVEQGETGVGLYVLIKGRAQVHRFSC